jgi:putative DNA primase/helicase
MGDEHIRGLGVWKDSQRVIVHLGDCLMVDGKKYMMSRIPSKYIYEKKRAVESETFEPLDLAGANKVVELVEKFRWNRAINARLLVGWIVAAIMGGSLPWRPHLWINGPQACGKSSILKDIVRRILGNCVAIFIEGATTEAGLRQQANHCSFPILFDEAESNDRKGQVRMEQIIELMRTSASPDGGKIVKGSSGGSAMTFDVQSCFCLASISNNSYLAADVARIVNLEMNTNDGSGEKWEIFRQRIIDTLNPEWCGRFRARVFKMVPVIRQNIDVFIRAVRDELDSQRYGDVYGVLLGSAYSYFSDRIIDYDAARAWVRERDWTEEKRLRHESDDTKCLVRIMERIVTIKQDGFNDEKTLWEIIKAVEEHEQRTPGFYPEEFGASHDNQELKVKAMVDTARRYGVVFRQEGGQKWVIIDNHNSYIRAWLKDTQYIPNWSKFLKRIRERIGDTVYEARVSGPRRTAENTSTRGVMIPFIVVQFFMESDDEEKT